jgi:2,3-bisphosphoglycerate-independent phosphoglycerate mutase
MKYIIFLGDGMADLPVDSLGGRSPLMAANIPNMDRMASNGLAGLVRTVPPALAPGSDTANMSVMGFDPESFYSGRSPLEAVSMGIDLGPDDIAFRCNLVTLGQEQDNGSRLMHDYSADEISSSEAAELISFLQANIGNDQIKFYPGKSYRHCLVWKNGLKKMNLTPPHDILMQNINRWLPAGEGASVINQLMRKSQFLLNSHPVNKKRHELGLNPANSIWIWGQGTKPQLPRIADEYGLKGSVISAVDLIFGLGICAGMETIEVDGATGNIHTNYAGKANAAIDAFERGQDYVYLHLEAPDECGHRAEIENKVKAIEWLDSKIIGPVWHYLESKRRETGEDYRMMVLPDHPTPLALRTHTGDPVPFAIFSSDDKLSRPARAYDEQACFETGLTVEPGHTLFGRFVRAEF